MEGHEAIWAETTDGGLLKQLFGHYPTLHEASIRTVDVDRTRRSASMVVDYSDSTHDQDGDSLTVRMRLEWTGVFSIVLPLGDDELMGVAFSRKGDLLETTLETWPGVYGTVISERFEAVLMQVDPADADEKAWLRFS